MRQLHEQLGWARPPNSGRKKAAAILDFVRNSRRRSGELAAACLRFHQHPLTIGFQSGAPSPILNAPRPDDFAIMHSKSLRVVNFFGHRRASADLTDYPAANAAALQLVQRIADVGGVPPELELAPVDRFDLFCDWLVTVEQYNFRHTHYWLIRLDESAPGGNHRMPGAAVASWRAGLRRTGRSERHRRAEFNAMRSTGRVDTRRNQTQHRRTLASSRASSPATLWQSSISPAKCCGAWSPASHYFVPDAERGHRRPVEWTDLQRRRPGDALDKPCDFQSIDAARFLRPGKRPAGMDKRALRRSRVSPNPPTGEDGEIGVTHGAGAGVVCQSKRRHRMRRRDLPVSPERTLAQIAAESGFSESQLATWVDAVERKGQAISYGPPGTGKSYVAAQLALHLAGGDDGFVESVQFHPAYAYEDFVQGIRPVADADGRLTYRLTPGLLCACAEAACRRVTLCAGDRRDQPR
ncbi:MAG: hypothetical protein R2856_12335 [Caldilineaceae bacterium]